METSLRASSKEKLFRLFSALQRNWDRLAVAALALCLALGLWWGFLRSRPHAEMQLRRQLVLSAQDYLGCKEEDGSYLPILEAYNTQESLPRGYSVTADDSWCAVFATVAARQAGLGQIVPPECSCGQMIELFREQGTWVEADWYLPRPGDYIFYDWDKASRRDSTGWPDHVGIVVRTFGPVIKVIEGNKDDMVTYRYVFLDDVWIRGYGTPDFAP